MRREYALLLSVVPTNAVMGVESCYHDKIRGDLKVIRCANDACR